MPAHRSKTMALLRVVHHEINLALWAILAASVIYFAAFVAPKLPDIRATAERIRLQQIAAENRMYCTRWGMGPQAAMHDRCLIDLQEFRTRIENRVTENVW